MMVTNEGKRRIGDQQLGVLFDGGKVRCRREWRGVKDTLYDYGRWLYILSLHHGEDGIQAAQHQGHVPLPLDVQLPRRAAHGR